MELSEMTVAVRLLLAVVCSGVLGLERTRKRRAAGLRTYMLVCVGATVVMLTAQFMSVAFAQADLGRMPAQVISGIGFLGAGTIMVTPVLPGQGSDHGGRAVGGRVHGDRHRHRVLLWRAADLCGAAVCDAAGRLV